MSSTSSPPISSSTTASTPAATDSSSSPGASPPIFVGFVGVGILTLCLISLCVWRRLIARTHPLAPALRDDPNARLGGRPQNDSGLAGGRPEMFDAWTGERVSDGGLEWENSMPFSVTIVESGRASDAALRKGKAGKRRGNSENLQVAVLVAMPSPLHARRSHDGRSSLRGELAIGLIEMPWIKEDRHSAKRNAS
ncbi:hypothetical protein EDB84DRAFT_606506 [Lactarius hengduanensis]|nr:hypothetical protein EDB84DRAFT_606506 [Lactarius hengduanensis]